MCRVACHRMITMGATIADSTRPRCGWSGDATDEIIEAVNLAADEKREEANELIDRLCDRSTANALMVLGALDDNGGSFETSHTLTQGLRKVRIDLQARCMRSARCTDQDFVLCVTGQVIAPLKDLLLGVSLLRDVSAQTMDLAMSFGERISTLIVSTLVRATPPKKASDQHCAAAPKQPFLRQTWL